MYEKPECDPRDLLMEISDPAERARTAWEWGIVDWLEGRVDISGCEEADNA